MQLDTRTQAWRQGSLPPPCDVAFLPHFFLLPVLTSTAFHRPRIETRSSAVKSFASLYPCIMSIARMWPSHGPTVLLLNLFIHAFEGESDNTGNPCLHQLMMRFYSLRPTRERLQ
jgi:hypothetical protein